MKELLVPGPGPYYNTVFAHTSPEAEAAWAEYREAIKPRLRKGVGASKREFLAGWYLAKRAKP